MHPQKTVALSIMENAANGEAAATEPSTQSPDMIDTPKEESVAEVPALTSEGDHEGESPSQTAESSKEATSAPSETKSSVNEASSLHKRSLSVVLKLPLQEMTEKKEKKNKDGDKRHRKALSSVMPVIPAALNQADWTDQIRIGICAMDKKARSKPMAEILSRLDEKLFRVIFFGDQTILHTPVEEWPVCDVLIAFHSKGYPLDKAKQYVKLVDPFILNDLEMQQVIKDRRKIYDLLEASGIDVPRHVFLSRDGYVSTGTGGGNGNNDQEVMEYDDHIEVNGVIIHKPFVEKPVNADDHNIAIYYPSSAGGGCKKLFRKIGNRSSEFYADVNEVRRDGSYIYEQFVETQGTSIAIVDPFLWSPTSSLTYFLLHRYGRENVHGGSRIRSCRSSQESYCRRQGGAQCGRKGSEVSSNSNLA
jgi:inositol hexakisphosphate/diphosphoinositol-pentakisphosphate kinase